MSLMSPPWSPAPATLDLPSAETHVFVFPLEAPGRRLAELERQLSADELARADRFRHARDRRRYVVGRAELRTILGRYLGRRASQLRFRHGPHGKPALQDGSDAERLRFSVSRSHELALVAVQADDDVGVDVAHVRPLPDALEITGRFFAPQEREVLRSLPAAERDAAFFSYWTRKEAVVKSTGLGVSQGLDAFVLARPSEDGERVVIAGRGEPLTRWVRALPPPAAGYVAAVATAGGPRPLRCWTWADQ
jgi:4'-phosphopantetheinyl transferase